MQLLVCNLMLFYCLHDPRVFSNYRLQSYILSLYRSRMLLVYVVKGHLIGCDLHWHIPVSFFFF